MRQLAGFFCGLLALLPVPALAQETTEAPIVLVPYVDEAYALEASVPAGWTDVGNGTFVSPDDPDGITRLLLQSGTVNRDGMLTALLPLLGLIEAPEVAGTHASPALDWTLYEIDYDPDPIIVDLAITASDGRTYLVIMATTEDRYEALHTEVFLPALDSLIPHLPALAGEVPYEVEELSFKSGDVTIGATLTLPQSAGPHPVLVLVSGSGPQDRDGTLIGGIAIKPFLLIADALTREGIAVLRYDERGVGASTGDFASATTYDFADDAEAAIAYLLTREDIDPDQIGLLGHSEGGLIAAMLGARNADLDFLVSMAGPAVSGYEILRLQGGLIMQAEGTGTAEDGEGHAALIDGIFERIDDPAAIEEFVYATTIDHVAGLSEQERAEIGDVEAFARENARAQAAQFGSDWFKAFMRYDPAPDWAKTKVPVLALFGGKDMQVDAGQNAPALAAALSKADNDDYAIVIIPNANHLFQQTSTGAPSEYATLPAEFAPGFLPALEDWLAQHLTISE